MWKKSDPVACTCKQGCPVASRNFFKTNRSNLKISGQKRGNLAHLVRKTPLPCRFACKRKISDLSEVGFALGLTSRISWPKKKRCLYFVLMGGPSISQLSVSLYTEKNRKTLGHFSFLKTYTLYSTYWILILWHFWAFVCDVEVKIVKVRMAHPIFLFLILGHCSFNTPCC